LPYERHQLTVAIEPDGTLANIAQRIFSREPEDNRAWAANRLIVLENELPESLSKLLASRQEFLEGRRSEFLASHACTLEDVDALAEDKKKIFLEGRQQRLYESVKNFLERMAGTKLEDTPPLSSFDLDDMDGRDDPLT
jgi:hypothetical protein